MQTSELADPLAPISPRDLLAHYARQRPRHALVREPNAAAGIAPQEIAPPKRGTRRRFAIPAWLVSLLVHGAALSVLAILTIAPLVRVRRRTIEIAQLGDPPRMETLDAVTTAIAIAPARRADTSASLAGAGALTAVARPVQVDELSLTPIAISLGDWNRLAGQRGAGAFGGGSLRTLLNTPVDSGQSAQFFGVRARGGTFVFVVDNSRSMIGGKFADAKAELANAIRRLSSGQSFYVIFFSGSTICMQFASHAHPEPAPVSATPENVALLDDWMAGISTLPNTDPTEALQIAVEMSPDAIFLLSDGEFDERSRTLRYLTAHNRTRNLDGGSSSRFTPKIAIHTIAFWENAGEKTMRKIARSNGGDFRFVPPPRRVLANRH